MKCWLSKNNVPWTFGGSPWAWLMNCLRVVGPVERRLAERFIKARREVDGQRVAIQLQGYEGELFFPRELPIQTLFQTLVEQLYAWHWHYYQIPQTRITADDVVFDCGCAEGIFTFLNHRRAKQIIGFEPLPAFVESLTRTFSNTPNVKIVACALAEQPGSAFIREAGIGSALTSETTATPVSVESIDSYCEKHDARISYLKADLEGYEMNVLRGAAKAIKLRKPRVAITTYHNRDHAREIVGFLRSLNSDYQFLVKGICRFNGNPIMLHAW